MTNPLKIFCSALLWLLCLQKAQTQARSTDTLTVHFAFNLSILPPAEKRLLDQWLTNPSLNLKAIQLLGYCDNIGGDRYNDNLSLQRINTVKAYLQSKGMTDTLFTLQKPYGKHMPLNDNSDEEKRSLNRRVTIVAQVAGRQTVAQKNEPQTTGLTEAFRDTTALIGKNITLKIFFYGASHHPLPTSIPVLQELLSIMNEHPHLKVGIDGHICCMPPDMDGMDLETRELNLSVQRAKYIYDYLADHGVDTSRMTYRGFGASRKIYTQELDESQKTMNRRVELRILDIR